MHHDHKWSFSQVLSQLCQQLRDDSQPTCTRSP